MTEAVIRIENLKKQYHLGAIGGGTLVADLQSWWAERRGKEDPNTKIGEKKHGKHETFWALNGINLEIKKGEAIGIIGANGAGKSTLLKVLSRVTAPTEGDVYIKGRVTSMLEVGTGFHPEMTGRENIYMNGAILGMSRKEVDAKIDDIIKFSECGQFIDTPVKRYSSGMYVKLAFSVAAHLDSDIMIMDEVLAVGDMKFQEKCLSKMEDGTLKDGKTVLYVSHNMSTVRQLCKRCIVLSKGKIIFDGETEEAIGLYMNNYDVSDTHIDFHGMERPGQETGEIWLSEYWLRGKKESAFVFGEKMHFTISLESDIDAEGISIRLTLFYIDNTPVSTIYTPRIINVKKGKLTTVDICADISTLAPGKYYADVIVWKYNESAAQIRYDAVKGKISFRIEAGEGFNHGFDWGHKAFGHVVLPSMVVENE